MTTSKPRIFISSTIYDFKDLRSALKYWLQQLGYEVLLSEFNDFTKPLDENSYNACLRTVAISDYYILFIGSRVGGFYNRADKISVTRMEYRTAYKLMKSKALKLVVFVRDELLKVKGDRKALEAYLEKDLAIRKEISPSNVQKIINHPSDIVNDAEAIFGFIDEVARAGEMKEATQGKGPFPNGNWIHTYSTFQDVIEVLSRELGIVDKLSEVALRENLKRELLSNLWPLTLKNEGKIIPFYDSVSFARQRLTGDINDSSQISSQHLKQLVEYALAGNRGNGLSTRFIDQALITGEFLEYDFDLNRYRSGPINNALFDLREIIERLRFIQQSWRGIQLEFVHKYNDESKTQRDVSVSNSDLFMPFVLADRQQDIVTLSAALIKALDGDMNKLSNLRLNPPSPFREIAQEIKNETATTDELTRWLNEQ